MFDCLKNEMITQRDKKSMARVVESSRRREGAARISQKKVPTSIVELLGGMV